MIVTVELNNETVRYDLDKPIDISLPIKPGKENTKAWFANDVLVTPIKAEGFLGSVKDGGAVNSNYITFNPHGNGTHTECVGHITPEFVSINNVLKKFHFNALLITVSPTRLEKKLEEFMEKGDWVIMKEEIERKMGENLPEALIIRTNYIPETKKLTFNYSGTNPAYLHPGAAKFINKKGIDHLLIDLPSVDKENDGNQLLAHKFFWNYPAELNQDKTITELIHVPSNIKDGTYLLNLQIANFSNNAAPSKPVLYTKKM